VVEGGLPAGSLVVVDNLQKLREGAPVNPQASQKPAGDAAPSQPSGR
jgi:membrane fusion protein (multidrug efflux system)